MIYLEKLEEAKKKGRCWTGYKPKAGSVPYSKGSCVKEAYQRIGSTIDEAMFGKIRTKIADKLDKFASNQYKKGESDEASGKERRAAVRGRLSHFAGKVAQKVRPIKEGYQQIGHILAEVISPAVLANNKTVKRRLDRRKNVVAGRAARAKKNLLDPTGTNSPKGVRSENKDMHDQVHAADVTRSDSYRGESSKK